MKLEMVKLTNYKTNISLKMSKKKWQREVRKMPALVIAYKVEPFTKEIPSFKFVAWVHPKKGGDDYQVQIEQPGKNIQEAKAHLEIWLRKISNVHDDYMEVRS